MMPLHRRTAGRATASESAETDTNEDAAVAVLPPNCASAPNDGRSAALRKLPSSDGLRRFRSAFFGGAQCFLVAGVLWHNRQNVRSIGHALSIVLATLLFSSPLFLLAAAALVDTPRFAHERLVPMAMLATVVGNNLPTVLTTAAATGCLLLFGLASRPVDHEAELRLLQGALAPSTPIHTQKTRSRTSISKTSTFMSDNGPMPTLRAILIMIGVLLVENFCVWVVSATYAPSHNRNTLPNPLQDNGQIAMKHFFKQVIGISKHNVVRIRNMVNVQWTLVSGLGLSFVAIVMQGPALGRNIFSFARRAVLALAVSRFLRTVSFVITVLPSQNKYCYFRKFPDPPPNDWQSWILQGMVPYSSGGCNDLVVSGHATVTATIACLLVSAVPKTSFALAVWMLVAMDYMVEVYEGFHYSVDMWLGCIIANFAWNTFAPVEGNWMDVYYSERNNKDKNDAKTVAFKPIRQFSAVEFVRYAIPPFGCFLQVTRILPREMGNYTIIAYVVAAVVEVRRFGFHHYARHILFCLLYMALGVYL